jgi:selT/selW/selH-like putative selenoprotein
LAEELKNQLGLDVTLVEGKGGVFDVICDGSNIFSKFSTHRFPDKGEVVALLKGRPKA